MHKSICDIASTRILGSETTDPNQDHKRRCFDSFENLVVRKERILTQQNVQDVKCAVEAEVIDDTALIEITDAVTGFKNRYRKETDVGYGKHSVNDGKKNRNKGLFKKEKKVNNLEVEDEKRNEKKINTEGKGQKVYRKMPAKVKYVYQRKDIKKPRVENLNGLEKIFGEAVQETDVSLKVSIGIEKESTAKFAVKKIFGVAMQETDENLKESVETEKESNNKLVETETAIEKDAKNNEAEDENVHGNTSVGSKKIAYSREEIEALRSVDEEGQKSKWVKAYSGFAPLVAREYAGLVVDAYNRPTQRYTRVVNCGTTRYANAILGVPPVLPLCSPSNCI